MQRFKPKLATSYKRERSSKDKFSMQAKSSFGVTGGMKLSSPPIEIEDNFLSWANNVYFYGNKIKKRNGYVKYGTETPLAGDPVMDITQFYKYDGTTYTCAFTTRNMYVYNTATKKWDVVTQHVDVSDCENAWVATASVTCTASTIKRYGTYSAKQAITTGKTGLVASRAITSADLQAYTHIYFYIRSSKVVTAGQLQILLDDTAACATPLELLDVPAIPIADTWYEFCVALATPAALGAVISVGLKVVTDILGADVYLDNIMAVKCLTGTSTDRINTEQIYDDGNGEVKFIFTNGIDNIKSWTGSGNWADLGGTPNRAKRLINYNHYLMLMNTYVTSAWAPQRVEWPQIGKPTTWAGEDAGNNSLATTADFIEGAAHIRTMLAILKDRSITLCSFIGGVDPFSFDENKIEGNGTISDGSVQSLGDSIIYLGEDNVYIFDGFGAKPKGDNIITRLIEDINQQKVKLIHSQIMRDLKLYLLFVPSPGSDYPDMCWVFNYEKETWAYWEFADTITCCGFIFNETAVKIGELLGTIGSMNFRLGSNALRALSNISLFGSSDGYIYQYDKTAFNDDGAAIDGYLDTKSYVFNAVNLYSFLCQIALFGKGGDVEVLVSKDSGVTFTSIGTIAQNTTQELTNFLRKIDIVSDKFLVRFRNNVVNEWFEITGWELSYIEKTRVV